MNERLVIGIEHVYVEQRDSIVEKNVEQKVFPDELINTPTPSVVQPAKFTHRVRLYYTVSQKKHVTTFSTKTLTVSVRFQ